MRIFLRKLIKQYASEDIAKALKKFEFKQKRSLVKKLPAISREKFKHILKKKLGLSENDNVFIHASSAMMNTDLSPAEMIDVVRECVGESAIICVPTFPRMSSVKFLKRKKSFDRAADKSGMGTLSEYVRTMPEAYQSNHPIKSIAGIGAGVERLLLGHENSEYSFDQGSPFFKMLKKNFKVIGIGAQMSYLTYVHVAEDCNRDEYPIEVYHSDKIIKKIKNDEGGVLEKGYYAHNLDIVSRANPEKFVRRNMKSSDYRIFNHYLTPFFIVDADGLYNTVLSVASDETVYY